MSSKKKLRNRLVTVILLACSSLLTLLYARPGQKSITVKASNAIMQIPREFPQSFFPVVNYNETQHSVTVYAIQPNCIWTELNENPDITYKIYINDTKQIAIEDSLLVSIRYEMQIDDMTYQGVAQQVINYSYK